MQMFERIKEIFEEILSIIIALVRLIFLTLAMFTSAVQVILFTRTEVWNIELKGMPWRCDRDKMDDQISFVDSLMSNNPDLLDFADEQMRKDDDLPPDIGDEGDA